MPRPVRDNIPGRLYHVISRFIEGKWLITDAEDRETYLRMLGYALRASDWRCLAFAVMSNHLHYAMVAGESPMESWSKSVHSNFGQWINRKRKRIGPVFANRPIDHEVRPQDTASVLAYIHNNPVRAKTVSFAVETDWTSHRAYTGEAGPPQWLNVEEGLVRAGFEDRLEFDRWVNQQNGQPKRVDLRAVAKTVRRRGALQVATPADDAVTIVARPFARVRPDPREVVDIVAQLARVPVMEVCSRLRRPQLVEARRMVVSVGRSMGICGSDLASVLGISEPGVSRMSHSPLSDRARDTVRAAIEVISNGATKVALVNTVPRPRR